MRGVGRDEVLAGVDRALENADSKSGRRGLAIAARTAEASPLEVDVRAPGRLTARACGLVEKPVTASKSPRSPSTRASWVRTSARPSSELSRSSCVGGTAAHSLSRSVEVPERAEAVGLVHSLLPEHR